MQIWKKDSQGNLFELILELEKFHYISKVLEKL